MGKRKFEDIFEECLAAILAGQRSLDECLALYPQAAQELQPLLETALDLRASLQLEPSAAFRERARHRFLMAVASRPATAVPVARPLWRWAPVAAAGLVGVAVLAFLSVTLLNEDGGGPGLFVQTPTGVETPTAPVVSEIRGHIEQVKAVLESIKAAVDEKLPVEPADVEKLRESNTQLVANLGSIESLTDEDQAEIIALATRQQEVLPQADVPVEARPDLVDTLALAQAMLSMLGVQPTVTETPMPTPAVEATPTPEPSPTVTPEVTPAPEETVTPEVTVTPEASPTPEEAATPVE